MICNQRAAAVAFATLGWLALNSSAMAETLTFSAKLDGASEVPATTSTGKGDLTASLDTISKQLSWKGSYSGLTGDATAAHFHGPAAAGANAGVVVPIPSFKSPFPGAAGLTDAQVADLTAGKWYVNIHSAKFPSGEIRGQMVKDQ